MIKTRIIPVLLWDGNVCIKPKQFKHPGRNVGSLMQNIKVMESRDVDEIILLDITATKEKHIPWFERIKEFTEELFCPCTIGGGISSLWDIEQMLRAGADKVSINSVAINFDFIEQAAKRFGSQCITVSVDSRSTEKFAYRGTVVKIDTPYIECGTRHLNMSTLEYCKELCNHGAGEILLTSIDRDGTRTGYDVRLIEAIAKAVSVPVVANGGCGGFNDMGKALEAGASAVAASSMFLFTPLTPKNCALYLDNHGFKMRV